jgi:phosphatidyl-myo-inositol alpha-mannosyltransferase
MRVAIVSPYDLTVPGGVQAHVRLLARALRAEGDDVVILGPGPAGGVDAEEIHLGRSMGVPFNGAVAPIALGPGTGGRVRRALSRLDPDVVHVHEPLVPVVGPAALRSANAPVVITFHASSARDRLYRSVRILARARLQRAHTWIAVSDIAARYHARALNVPIDRFSVIPNGVDVARFAEAERDEGLARGAPTVLFVGRLEPRKGIEVLLAAVPKLVAHHPDLAVLVVGDGPLRARAERALPEGLRDRVRFLGRVDGERLAACHASADVFVAPALGGESFGIVLLEALAAGTPVVASGLAAYRSVLDDGRCGVLVPPGDAPALAGAVAAVLTDHAATARRTAAGRTRADAHDWSVVAQHVRQQYVRALAG